MSEQARFLGTAEVPVDELAPFPGNPRRGDVSAIAASLRRNGQYRAIVVRVLDDGSRVILAGNHTWQALKAEGLPVARCDLIACDDETARRIVLADNKTAELGDYDPQALSELLASLAGDLDGTGWTDAELVALGVSDPGYEPREAPEEFAEFGADLPTNRQCPSCGYEWMAGG